MSYAQYLLLMAGVSGSVAAIISAIVAPFKARPVSHNDWIGLLAALYPHVASARTRAAELARRFYDAERALRLGPELIEDLDAPVPGQLVQVWPRQDVNLAPYEPEWFEESMENVRENMARLGSTDNDVAQVVNQALKEVEKGGRTTTRWAADEDQKVLGWARVEGNENVGSCAFCAMLISRGPVYKYSPENSGLRVDDDVLAVEIWRKAQETGDESHLMSLMNRWHKGCDCKVVPVFDRSNWTGKDQFEEFEKLWATVTKGETAGNRSKAASSEALNAFRRYLETGKREYGTNVLRFPQAA